MSPNKIPPVINLRNDENLHAMITSLQRKFDAKYDGIVTFDRSKILRMAVLSLYDREFSPELEKGDLQNES